MAARFPRSVYGVGREPDPRFTLANERTFLASTRTALALIAAGVALEAIALPGAPALRHVAGLVLLGLGFLAPLLAWATWQRTERAIRLEQPLPSSPMLPVLVAGVAVVAALVLVGVLV